MILNAGPNEADLIELSKLIEKHKPGFNFVVVVTKNETKNGKLCVDLCTDQSPHGAHVLLSRALEENLKALNEMNAIPNN